jgi:hypothetical protein
MVLSENRFPLFGIMLEQVPGGDPLEHYVGVILAV